mmetsp:Transcript_24290/g.54029  ORF Transcript_24290/g.54029 Transcript_24290/m.54029 type:complete len:273 (-) Transcript_24290:1021-1839(-)
MTVCVSATTTWETARRAILRPGDGAATATGKVAAVEVTPMDLQSVVVEPSGWTRSMEACNGFICSTWMGLLMILGTTCTGTSIRPSMSRLLLSVASDAGANGRPARLPTPTPRLPAELLADGQLGAGAASQLQPHAVLVVSEPSSRTRCVSAPLGRKASTWAGVSGFSVGTSTTVATSLPSSSASGPTSSVSALSSASTSSPLCEALGETVSAISASSPDSFGMASCSSCGSSEVDPEAMCFFMCWRSFASTLPSACFSNSALSTSMSKRAR